MVQLLERRLIRIPLLIAFAILMLVICIVLTFPDERIKQIVIVQAEAALNRGKTSGGDDTLWEVQIEDLDLWWLTGIELEGVTLRERWTDEQKADAAAEASDSAPPRKPLSVMIPRVAGRLSLLKSLINLGGAAEFMVDFEEGGVIDGVAVLTGETRHIEAEIDALDVLRSKLLESATGVPGFGKVDGTIALDIDAKSGQIVDGQIALKGSKLTVGPATVKSEMLPSMAYIEVPQTNFGNLDIQMSIEKKKGARTPRLTIDKFKGVGRDVLVDVWGYLDLASKFASSRASVDMRMQFDKRFVKENSLTPILQIKQLRSGKSADDWYGLSLRGALARAKPSGSMRAAKGPPASKGGGPQVDEEPENEAPTKRQRTRVPAPSRDDDDDEGSDDE